MTGLMSLAGALMGRPPAEILGSLPLLDEIKAGILQRSGVLGALLNLVEALEADEAGTLSHHLHGLPGLHAHAVNASYLEAMTWADSLGIETR
jgi:EAL and modified HD-GYP domain-containing signal transduction protein